VTRDSMTGTSEVQTWDTLGSDLRLQYLAACFLLPTTEAIVRVPHQILK
jgi:hypothetical protein